MEPVAKKITVSYQKDNRVILFKPHKIRVFKKTRKKFFIKILPFFNKNFFAKMTLFWQFFYQLFYENFCFFGFVHNLLIFSKKEVNGY